MASEEVYYSFSRFIVQKRQMDIWVTKSVRFFGLERAKRRKSGLQKEDPGGIYRIIEEITTVTHREVI